MSEAQIFETSEETIWKAVKPRRVDSRKGENGIVAVVGGSRFYHGAPCLSALAAYRAGVDLVYLAVPRSISVPVRAISPSFIVLPLPDDKLTLGCVNKLLKWLPKVDAAVVGPGLGRQKTEGMERLVTELSLQGVRLVVDADALRTEVIRRLKGKPAVITPHAGEFKRIFDVELERSLESRLPVVKEMAKKSGVTILLKGPVDVISDGERVAVNHTGTSAMTVGGTGDVLSGLVAGLMARGAEPFDAASAGAYINGIAGKRVAERLGFHIVPTDVIDELPFVLKGFDREVSSE